MTFTLINSFQSAWQRVSSSTLKPLLKPLTAMLAVTGTVQGVSLNDGFTISPSHGLIDFEAGGGVNAEATYLSGSALGTTFGLIYFGNGSPTDGVSYSNDADQDTLNLGVNVDGEGYLSGYAFNYAIGLIHFDWAGAESPHRPRINPANGQVYGLVFNAELGLLDLNAISANIHLAAWLDYADRFDDSGNIFDGDDSPDLASKTDYSGAPTSSGSVVQSYSIYNSGYSDLVLSGSPQVSVNGAHASNFSVTSQPSAAVIPPDEFISFEVTFTPIDDGVVSATISIPSNDADEADYTFAIQGYGIGTTKDLDGDGMNDLGEYKLAALGFDWQTGGTEQESLVGNFITNANDYQLYNQTQYDANASSNLTDGQASVLADPNAFELYELEQVQALHIDAPLLERDPSNGEFTLTIGLQKSTNLVDFNTIPLPAPSISVNEDGKIELRFTPTDNAAFFRIEAK